MNREEARRFAHQLIADAIAAHVPRIPGPDAAVIDEAIARIVEQHRRFGPKSTDRPPRPPVYVSEPLDFLAERS